MRYLIIDIRPLLPKNPPTGVPEYTRELLKAMLPLLAKKRDVRTFLFSSGQEKPNIDMIKGYASNYTHYHLGVPNKFLNASSKLFNWPHIDRLFAQVFAIPKRQPITVFTPNINLLPLSSRARLVLTFHDLSFERYPFFLRRREALWHRLVNPYNLARRAQAIIAVSHSTKQDLVNIYNIKPSLINVIYSGVGDEFMPNRRRTAKNILYLGSSDGRKNVDTLVRAFAIVKQRLSKEPLSLVLAGPPHQVVSFEERLALYQQAELFVYPSFFEGFGFPPLEAMKCGVPVITSHTSSLPEAVGDAALMVHPHRVQEFARAMQALLQDSPLRHYYIQKGLVQARRFSWEKAAKETLEILLEV